MSFGSLAFSLRATLHTNIHTLGLTHLSQVPQRSGLSSLQGPLFERLVLLGAFKQVFVTLFGYVSFAPVSFFATAPPYQKSYLIAALHFADF